ncbi:MAG: hypothetical protein J5659_00765 [Clostridia bacterium]|nr:hypothetical protein [Clostridia bacterium]
MDNRYIGKVIEEMSPFLAENGFHKKAENEYESEKCSILIEYDDARQMYILKKAEPEGEYAEISAWLFDDSQTERDAVSVGIDFTETLSENLGVKKNSRLAAAVDMPTANKDGADIGTFAKKVLDVYPQFKEPYRAHIQKYGNFLYLNFFGETLVPQLKQTLASGDKKAIKKIFTVFDSTYITGDRDTVNAMLACIAAASLDDDNAKKNLAETLRDNNHMLRAVAALSERLKTNKKLSAALIK